MTSIKSITVFCGASTGEDPLYASEARKLGRYLASSSIDVIYGGGRIGIMGILADATLENSGKVIGVIPKFLSTKEVAHSGLTQMHVVDSMHERKMMMHQLGDAVLALPGGYGTLEELFEMLTWAQLGLHPKPIALLNTKGYFDHLLKFLDRMVEEKFLSEMNRSMVLVHNEVDTLISMMKDYTAPDIPKWITDDEV